MNYFDDTIAAQRYAKGRPDFHATPVGYIKAYLNITDKLEHVLDVACGTGLSTVPLLAIAHQVSGTDISENMLEHAPKADGVNYYVAPAEKLPFADNSIDLITVSSGVHWFDIDKFLKEAKRVLKSKGHIALYETYFYSEMEGVEEFRNWHIVNYSEKYPMPPRNSGYDFGNDNINAKGFTYLTEERFKNSIHYNKQQLVLYFTTQSNIIAAVERGETTYTEAEEFLSNELSLFFEDESTVRKIYYGHWVKYLQRID